MENSGGKQISRRSFLGTAAIGAAGLMGAAFAAPLAMASESAASGSAASGGSASGSAASAASAASGSAATGEWDQQADVVVIGGGAAAHAAAIEAAGAGASVIMLEKTTAAGGDSMACDGILAGWGTDLQKAQGIEMTADDIYGWFMAHPEWYGSKDPEIARVLADNSGQTITWLEELGVPFESEVDPRFGYTDLPVIHQVDGKGAAMMTVLIGAAADAGVTTLLETRATGLVKDDSGRVIGVEAAQAAGTIRVKAARGVVMACGDYTGSMPMLQAMNPENAPVFPGSVPGNTGDSVVMAQAAGVMTTRMGTIPHLTSIAGMMTGTMVLVNYHERLHGLWLDANGERFFDEETEYQNPLGHRAILRKTNEQGFSPILLLGSNSDVDELLANQDLSAWATGDTIEDVAALVGLDAQKVAATVERFNGFCDTGVDEDFGRAAEYLIPMTGPFHAAAISLSSSVSLGGIKVNTKAQALKLNFAEDENGIKVPVPGLYAAGQSAEWNTAAGCTVLSAMTLGRIAGQNVAAEEPVA